MIKVSNIKNNPNNPRVIKDDKFKKLVKSIEEFPEMMEKRPMVCVTDVDGKIFPLGGNMRLRAIKELGIKEIPDSWVMMADDWTEEQKRQFIIKDNVGYGDWDWDELANGWDEEELQDWGLDIPGSKDLDEEDLFDIELPFYEPSKIKPEINELANISKTNDLISKIESLKIDAELKEILKIRASFFTDFNFQKIADYYYNEEEEEVKDVFKDLGLVILAPKEALERGFVELSESIFGL